MPWIVCWAAENDGVRSDQAVCTAEWSLAGIGIAHNDTNHVILCHAVAVVTTAADVRAVAGYACCNAVFAGAFEHRVIHTVHRNNAGAAAAIEDEGGIRIFDTAEIWLRHQGACHILTQIDAQTGQSVRIGSGEVRVGDNSRQRRSVILGDVYCREQTLDQGNLLLIGKMHHRKYLQ